MDEKAAPCYRRSGKLPSDCRGSNAQWRWSGHQIVAALRPAGVPESEPEPLAPTGERQHRRLIDPIVSAGAAGRGRVLLPGGVQSRCPGGHTPPHRFQASLASCSSRECALLTGQLGGVASSDSGQNVLPNATFRKVDGFSKQVRSHLLNHSEGRLPGPTGGRSHRRRLESLGTGDHIRGRT